MSTPIQVPAARQKFDNLRNRRYAMRESVDLRRQVFLEEDGTPAAAPYPKLGEVEVVVPPWYNFAKCGAHGSNIDVVVGAIYLTSIGVNSNVLMPLLDATQAVHTVYML